MGKSPRPATSKPPKQPYQPNPAIVDQILSRLADGETLRAICRDKDMPAAPTVIDWINASPELAERYARARRDGHDAIAEDIIRISDESRLGVKTERKEVGRACSVCGLAVRWANGKWMHILGSTDFCEGAKAEKVIEEKATTGDMVERARLQVDARKWLLSKLRPDKYGDRVAVDMTVTENVPAAIAARRFKRGAEPVEE